MDHPTNGQTARAPKIEDLVKLCRALNEANAHYILIGGIAVIFHGFVRGTGDIDFLVDDSIENIQKIKKALSILPDNAAAQMHDDELQKYSVIRIADEVVVDLLSKACQIGYKEASADIEYYEIDGIEIPVANKQLLIRMKDTIRPSDKMDVEYLRAALEQEKTESGQ